MLDPYEWGVECLYGAPLLSSSLHENPAEHPYSDSRRNCTRKAEASGKSLNQWATETLAFAE